MICPTCGHRRMDQVSGHLFWCERCGMLVDDRFEGRRFVPTLVERVREVLEQRWSVQSHQKLRECVYPPEEKKPTPYGNDWGDTETRHD